MLHGVEQLGTALLIGRIFAAIAGRMDPRCASQRVHCQPRIIGQGWHTENSGCKAGLLVGIVIKSRTVLFHRRQWPEIVKILDRHGEISQQFPNFESFSRITRGDHQGQVMGLHIHWILENLVLWDRMVC